jgi:hypothetical protein
MRPCEFLIKSVGDDWNHYRFHKDIGSSPLKSQNIPSKESEMWVKLRRKPKGDGMPFRLVCRVANVTFV